MREVIANSMGSLCHGGKFVGDLGPSTVSGVQSFAAEMFSYANSRFEVANRIRVAALANFEWQITSLKAKLQESGLEKIAVQNIADSKIKVAKSIEELPGYCRNNGCGMPFGKLIVEEPTAGGSWRLRCAACRCRLLGC